MPPSFLEKLAEKVLSQAMKETLRRIFRNPPSSSPGPTPVPSATPGDRSHPWRVCPRGKAWRRTHPRAVGISAKNPDGRTQVGAHCMKIHGGKEVLYPEEFLEIAARNFGVLRADSKTMPSLRFAQPKPLSTIK